MKIQFDDKPGEVYDIFNSLWFMNNYEFAKTRKEEFGVYKDNEFEKALISIYNDNKIDKEKLNRYFQQEWETNMYLFFPSVWEHSSITKYLEYVKSLEYSQLRTMIIDSVLSITDPGEALIDDITFNNYIADNETTMNFIEGKNISASLKWEFFLLLKDKDKYLNEYVKFINSYLKVYEKLKSIRKDILKTYNQDFSKKINNLGIDFLKYKINSFYDFSKSETIYVTTSILSSLIINESGANCYVIIGPNTDDVVANYSGQNDLENSLSTVKTICDSTRFKIVKLLLEKDCYGQEIADNLGITKSTVSHHISYLGAANLISINKERQRYYYSLKIDKLTTNMKHIVKELKIDLN